MKIDEEIQFSIITPVYNRSDCILRCINSVLNQDYSSYEIIIINDGSTDDTLCKINSLESKNTRIKIIDYPENSGVNYARNRGIEQVSGNYILFLDSDDELASDALHIIENYINQNQGYDHYLFCVSDRMNDTTLPPELHEFQYKDWLEERVKGDFAHVIKPSCFEGMLFIEEFRIYESLNWLRVFRKNERQLYIPWVALIRERNRQDSVTRESTLDDKRSLKNTYRYLCQYIAWYEQDFIAHGLSEKLKKRIRMAILIGISIGEQSNNENLISLLKGKQFKNLMVKAMNFKFFSPIIYPLFKLYAFLRH